MMRQSPAQQQYQPRCYEAYEFDYLQQDFSQLLEEAKHHANEEKLTSSSVHPEESGSGKEKEKKLKDKKSWKISLLSWLKADRKSKNGEEPTNNCESKACGCGRRRQVHVSGPIYNCGSGHDVKQRHPSSASASGSGRLTLTSLFRSRKRENESSSSSNIGISIPYLTLQQSSPHAVLHNYHGPIYVVT